MENCQYGRYDGMVAGESDSIGYYSIALPAGWELACSPCYSVLADIPN